ncbi:hypothetical protein AB6A40_006017 [Gnathostoma spinigerum]|uniref:Orn/DAP/Arg decarboxylase 2 N-terminal domain-containing protein n=1 Tax=Gnathostoma spinigerum TaxID=75299 RepID=A0ABD6EHC0_9BILA
MGRVQYLHDCWYLNLPRVQPFYALRCNADPVLLNLLAEQHDIGFYCSNEKDIDAALGLVSTDRIIYANPLWTKKTLRNAADLGINMISFESEAELRRIADHHPSASLVLRICVNPSLNEDPVHNDHTVVLKAPAIFCLAEQLGMKIVGLSFSVGAETRSLVIYEYAVMQCRRLLDVAASYNHHISILDIGGGFPTPTPLSSSVPSFQTVASAINIALDEYFPKSEFNDLHIIAEPGRYFAASAFLLVTNIIEKCCTDACNVTNDEYDSGSTAFIYHTNEGFFGSFGCLLSEKCCPCCEPLWDSESDIDTVTYASIRGPTHNDLDVIQSVTRLQQMKVGDWLLWKDMGAYSMGNEETLGETSTPSPNVYYFDRMEHWDQICGSDRSKTGSDNMLDLANSLIEDSLSISGTETDCQSLGDSLPENNNAFNESVLSHTDWTVD